MDGRMDGQKNRSQQESSIFSLNVYHNQIFFKTRTLHVTNLKNTTRNFIYNMKYLIKM